MGDTITAWHDMQDEKQEIVHANEPVKYIWLLDFNDGKAYRYDISALCN